MGGWKNKREKKCEATKKKICKNNSLQSYQFFIRFVGNNETSFEPNSIKTRSKPDHSNTKPHSKPDHKNPIHSNTKSQTPFIHSFIHSPQITHPGEHGGLDSAVLSESHQVSVDLRRQLHRRRQNHRANVLPSIAASSPTSASCAFRRCSSGSRYAAVLPEPVGAMPSMSRLWMMIGIDCIWMGVGSLYSRGECNPPHRRTGILDVLQNRFFQLALVTSERHVLKGIYGRGDVTPRYRYAHSSTEYVHSAFSTTNQIAEEFTKNTKIGSLNCCSSHSNYPKMAFVLGISQFSSNQEPTQSIMLPNTEHTLRLANR